MASWFKKKSAIFLIEKQVLHIIYVYFFINKQNMITQQECETLIRNQYIQNKSQRDNPSILMNVWWENRSTCLSYFWDENENVWPIVGLNQFLEKIDVNAEVQQPQKQTHNAPSETGQIANTTWTTQTEPIIPLETKTTISNFFNITFEIIIIVILTILWLKILQRCFRRWYSFFTSW